MSTLDPWHLSLPFKTPAPPLSLPCPGRRLLGTRQCPTLPQYLGAQQPGPHDGDLGARPGVQHQQRQLQGADFSVWGLLEPQRGCWFPRHYPQDNGEGGHLSH